MTTLEMSWSEILQAAGMEPGLAKAFDLIELRTPDARKVTDLTIALLSVREDVDSLKADLHATLERLSKLEEAESALVQILGEQIVELRKMGRQYETHSRETKKVLDELTTKVDALNAVTRNDRQAIERMDSKLEMVVVTQRQHGKDIARLQTDVSKLQTDVAEIKSDVAELKGDVAELKGDVAELKGDVVELKGGMVEVLAWVRAQGGSD